jgi:glycosyltransferase involved in cell wall biosynthesis
MKIAIVTNKFPAPSETFISNKVLSFAAKGHEVIVFCNYFDNAAWQTINTNRLKIIVELINRANITRFIISHPSLWRMATSKTKTAGELSENYLTNKLNTIKPAIIHFEFSGLGLQYLDTIKIAAGKKVVSCRGSGEKVKLLTDNSRKEKMHALFDYVDAIHCVSDDMRKTVLPYCKQPSKIFVNYPSIDATTFKRNTIYKHHTHLQVLSIGRLTFQKGYLTGLLAIKLLKKAGVNFNWVIAGDGPQKEEIIFHIHQLGLQNHITLAGTQTRQEVLKLYNNCDIFFLPSVYEGIANVALEAMSMEIPIVSTKSGGMDEVITNGINGMLADVYDSAGMAQSLLQLANDETLCKSIGQHARKTILGTFILEKQIEKFETVYNSLL